MFRSEPDNELMRFLLLKNAQMRFAKFALDGDDTILLERSLEAEKCNRNILHAAVLDLWEAESKFAPEIIEKGDVSPASEQLSEEQFAWLNKIKADG